MRDYMKTSFEEYADEIKNRLRTKAIKFGRRHNNGLNRSDLEEYSEELFDEMFQVENHMKRVENSKNENEEINKGV